MAGAVFDYHEPAHGGACAIRSARGSYSPAVNQTNFVLQVEMSAVCLGLGRRDTTIPQCHLLFQCLIQGFPSSEASL